MLVDREQGGRLNIENNGLQLHSVLTVSTLLEVLLSNGKIDAAKVASVKAFITANQVPLRPAVSPLTMSFETRAAQAPNQQAQALLTLMARKKSNLCFSADITRVQDLLDAVEQVAPHICLLKTHVDIIEDFTPALITVCFPLGVLLLLTLVVTETPRASEAARLPHLRRPKIRRHWNYCTMPVQ